MHLIVFDSMLFIVGAADGVGVGVAAISFGVSCVNLILIVGELNVNPYAAR